MTCSKCQHLEAENQALKAQLAQAACFAMNQTAKLAQVEAQAELLKEQIGHLELLCYEPRAYDA